MDAKPLPITKLFRNSAQYVIPVFQRHYVWDKETQWDALWEDLLSQTLAVLDGQPKPHYCGAIVLDRKNSGVDELARFDVIDGQQRLTTFQVILAALRDVAIAFEANESVARLIPLLINNDKDHLPSPDVDQFKLRPTRYDQQHFRDAITFGDREKLRQKYLPTRKGKLSYHTDARIVSAYLFFYDKLFQAVTDREDAFGSGAWTEEAIIAALVDAFTNSFQAVQIVLDPTDDAQVIFESLNSRGTPLLASDLMRNRIFLRAEEAGDNVERLFDQYWSRFEDKFWTAEEKQGRLKKPRMEFFMVNVLSGRNGSEVHLSRIYQEYLSWLSAVKFSLSVEDELQDLSGSALVYREMVEETALTRLGKFGRFLNTFDNSTLYPLIMEIWKAQNASDSAIDEIFTDLESYLVRRQVCRRETKNYSRLFLTAIRELRPKGFTPSSIREFLLGQTAPSQDWPSDTEFRSNWLTQASYSPAASGRVAYILTRVEMAQRSRFSEDVTINSTLTVEHILPQAWHENWPLPDGTTATQEYASEARTQQLLGLHLDERAQLAARRANLVGTYGNLTLLTRPLNSSISNGAFYLKKPAIVDQSALRLNRYFNAAVAWDEDHIVRRGEELFADALALWPRPPG